MRIACVQLLADNKVVWCLAGKRKRQDLQIGSSDCCTPELSGVQLPPTRHTAKKSGPHNVPSSRIHPKTTGRQVPMVIGNTAVTTSKRRRAAKQADSRQKTRLVVAASAVDVQKEPAVAEQAAQTGIPATSVPDSDDDGMPDATVDAGSSFVQPENMLQPDVVTDKGMAASFSEQPHGKQPGVIPVLLPGGSSRFSSRHLHQKVEAKLPVSKATPVGLPPTPLMPPVPQ